tara:strand:- start:4188 stop:4889 length:702 start_codon:yes stop_codon:yes gene_type:complete
MQTAEYNHEVFTNQQEADKGLMVRFFYKNVKNKMESENLGRPIFKEKTYIEIRVAGQRDVQACRPATHADKQRFPLHFDAFEKRMEPPTEGMPLSEWTKITRTQAEELSFMNVKTVEQLASMKDSNLQQYMNGYKLRDEAVKWLSKDTAETNDREKEELKATAETNHREKEELKASVLELQSQIAKLMSSKSAELDEVKSLAPAELENTEGVAVLVPAAPAGIPRKTRRKTET